MPEDATPHPTLYGDPVRQFDSIPRWYRWSGMAQVSWMTGTAWALSQALMAIDHQTARLAHRRHGRAFEAFEVTHDALLRQLGCGSRALQNAIACLEVHQIVGRYWAGRSGHASRFIVCRAMLMQLYRYVAPILPPEYQGVRDLDLRREEREQRRRDAGIVIYGEMGTDPLIAQWEWLDTWQHQALQTMMPEVPSPTVLGRIVENVVEKHPADNAGCGSAPCTECALTLQKMRGAELHLALNAGSHPADNAGSI